MAGILAFLFSTVVITFVSEIIPQAYFSRHAMKMASLLAPVLQVYQLLLYPLARPIAWLLDHWLGSEAIQFFQEKDLEEVIRMHMASPETDIDHLEGEGAINFLAMDDMTVDSEGEVLDPASVLSIQFRDGYPVFPEIERQPGDPFLQKMQLSGRKWVLAVDDSGEPHMVIDSDGFLRDALFGKAPFCPRFHCHRPVIIREAGTNLGTVIKRLRIQPKHEDDDVVDEDILLYWGESERRVITGADILGRLLRGIVRKDKAPHIKFDPIHSETPDD
jgi:hypothetical protein